MDRKPMKQKWNYYIRSNQNIAACVVALFAFIIIYTVLFQNPRPGVMDFGEYTQILYELGLDWTEEDSANSTELQFVKVIEQYEIGDISELKLLQVEPAQTLIYPVRFVGVICKLFGVNFSTKYLSFLLMIITVACIYSITKSLYCYFKQFAVVIGGILCFVLLCGNHIIYFNSLYSDGIFLVSLLLFATTLLHIITEGKNGIFSIVKLLLVSLFLLNASATGIFLLPIVIGAVVWMYFYCKPTPEKMVSYTIVSVALLAFIISANVRYTIQNESVFSNTQLYHAFFTGVLTNTDEPETILEELGLPTELVKDIGKNAYLSEENYVVGPYSEQAQELIYSKINYATLLKTYRKHPEIYSSILEKTANNSVSIDSSKFLYNNRIAKEGTEQVERFVWWNWVRKLILPSTELGYLLFFAFNIIITGVFIFFGRKEKQKKAIGIGFLILIFIAILQYVTACTFCGFAEVESKIHFFLISSDFVCIGTISACIFMFWKVIGFLQIQSEESRNEKEEYEQLINSQEVLNKPNPILTFIKESYQKGKVFYAEKVQSKPVLGAVLLTTLGVAVMILVLFCPRIGAYNNGDFGRMMSAMNLRYTAEDWENVDELSLTKVVEEYDWVEEYDYTKIMYYNADLTQIWMSVVIKIIDNYMGLQFSTVYVTILYVIILTICFCVIMKVMFERFGYKWTGMGIVLLFLVFDRGNLGWFNSLFGEGPAFVGLIMVIASSLYIVNKKRGTCTWGFIFLLFSINFFAGSKAQLTLTAPILLIWSLILAVYHNPKKIWKAIIFYPMMGLAFVVISITAISIYKSNEGISSPDTIFQSIFYGALMISDNPEADLVELGLDPAMAVDAGKHAYLDKSEYYCAPRTKMAEEMIYSKVNTITMLKFYLRHPDKLLIMMDATAKAAAEIMPDFVLYVGQKTTEDHDIVNKFRLWEDLRPYLVADRFWELVIIYGLALVLSVGVLVKKKYSGKDKLLIGMYLIIAGIGIVQFPLTIIGNGFADNTKQLYIFRFTYDITVIMGIFLLTPWFKSINNRITMKLNIRQDKKNQQEDKSI